LRVCAALLLMLISVGADAQTTQPAHKPQPTLRSGLKFSGDFMDGLATGPKVSPTGKHYVGLVQSKPNASPVPKDLAPIVDGLVEAYLTHHPERYSSYVVPGPISYIRDVSNPPHDFIPDGFPFDVRGKLTVNTPYYVTTILHSAPRIRIEWLEDGQLSFISWLEISDGKVVQIISDRASPPPLPRSAFDPPESPSAK
jgi:hypothetical protein